MKLRYDENTLRGAVNRLYRESMKADVVMTNKNMGNADNIQQLREYVEKAYYNARKALDFLKLEEVKNETYPMDESTETNTVLQ